jgi:hypothetical protein
LAVVIFWSGRGRFRNFLLKCSVIFWKGQQGLDIHEGWICQWNGEMWLWAPAFPWIEFRKMIVWRAGDASLLCAFLLAHSSHYHEECQNSECLMHCMSWFQIVGQNVKRSFFFQFAVYFFCYYHGTVVCKFCPHPY